MSGRVLLLLLGRLMLHFSATNSNISKCRSFGGLTFMMHKCMMNIFIMQFFCPGRTEKPILF